MTNAGCQNYMCVGIWIVKSPKPSYAYMRQWTSPLLFHIMTYSLFGAKPLSAPMLPYCWLYPCTLISIQENANDFHSWLRHSWKSLANRLTCEPKIIIIGNSCIVLYIVHGPFIFNLSWCSKCFEYNLIFHLVSINGMRWNWMIIFKCYCALQLTMSNNLRT